MISPRLLLVGLGIVCNDVHAIHLRASRQRCTLVQHAEDELALLRGRLPRHQRSCGSFQETRASLLETGAALRVKGVDYLSFIQMRSNEKTEWDSGARKAVWINGYPRSGSSTILSMVAAAGEEAREDSRMLGKTFSLFEPCHDGDAYEPWMQAEGCGRLLSGLAQCNFTGIDQLWGWPDSHTTSNHSHYAQDTARRLCQESRVTAFKTVDYGHNITDYRWFLDQQPQLRIIDIVRDPRGIYASWKTTDPFAKIVGTSSFYTLTEVCDTFWSNLDLNHANVHHVVFEKLTSEPAETMKEVYRFLGLPFTKAQESWVRKTFNAAECPEPKPWEVGFTDCHQDSGGVVEKWRSVLSDEEKMEFKNSPSCQKIVEAYGFAPE